MKHIPQQRKVSFIIKEIIVKLGSCSLSSLINDTFGQFTAKWPKCANTWSMFFIVTFFKIIKCSNRGMFEIQYFLDVSVIFLQLIFLYHISFCRWPPLC